MQRSQIILILKTISQPIWLKFAPVIFTLLWAGGYGVAKLALQYAEPFTLLTIRFGLVVLLLLPLYLIFRPKLPTTPNQWLHLVIVGALMQAVYFGCAWWAFRSGVSSGVLAISMSLQPILVAIVAPNLANEKVSATQWLGLLLGLIGVLVVILVRAEIEPPTIAGISFSILALLAITSGVIYEKRFGKKHHPIISNIVQYFAAFLMVLPAAFMFETMQVQWTGNLFAALAYLVIGNSIIAISLLLAMISAGEVSRVSSLMFLVPPLAAIFGWMLLGEKMPVSAWGGMAIAAVGVAIVTRSKATA